MASTWPELHSGTNFNYIWDTGTLAWIKQTAAAAGGGGTGLTDTELRASAVPVSLSAEHAEAALFVVGDKGIPALGVVNETIGVSALEGHYAPFAVDQYGHLSIVGSVSPIDAFGNSPIHRVDDAFFAAQSGTAAVAVRKATPVNLSGSDGDYEMLQVSAGRLWVDPSGVTLTVGTHAVTGPLTDTQLRASAVPVSLATLPALTAGAAVIGHVIADTGSTTAVTGNVAVTNAGLTNLDVALSTRTKPADQQHAIIDSGTTTVTQGTGTNLHTVVDSGTVTANAGTNLNTSLLALEATQLLQATAAKQDTAQTSLTAIAASEALGSTVALQQLLLTQTHTLEQILATLRAMHLQSAVSGELFIDVDTLLAN